MLFVSLLSEEEVVGGGRVVVEVVVEVVVVDVNVEVVDVDGGDDVDEGRAGAQTPEVTFKKLKSPFNPREVILLM